MWSIEVKSLAQLNGEFGTEIASFDRFLGELEPTGLALALSWAQGTRSDAVFRRVMTRRFPRAGSSDTPVSVQTVKFQIDDDMP